MKSRITRAIVTVVALVLVALGVPFAIVVQQFYENQATVELQRNAALAVSEIVVPLDAQEIESAAREPDSPEDFSVYDATGQRIYGDGPQRLTDPLDGELVVTSPITERKSEQVVGTVMVSTPQSTIAARTRKAWAAMAVAGLIGLAIAGVVASSEAARLSAPINDLVTAAENLGAGAFVVNTPPSGVTELDTLGSALALSGERLAELVRREREFSANASHQLRTPLTAVRMSIGRGDLDAATAEVDRLTATVEHLLSVSRSEPGGLEAVNLSAAVESAGHRWNPVFESDQRNLVIRVDAALPDVAAHASSVAEVLNVLIENALRHGTGTVRVTAESAVTGAAIEVRDEGPGVDATAVDKLLHTDRSESRDGRGLGLPLANTLVEADGGRLLLVDAPTATFRAIYLQANRADSPR